MRSLPLILIPILLLAAAADATTTVENVRIWSENGKTRVVLDLSESVNHNIFTLRGPDRLVVDLKDGRLAADFVFLDFSCASRVSCKIRSRILALAVKFKSFLITSSILFAGFIFPPRHLKLTAVYSNRTGTGPESC